MQEHRTVAIDAARRWMALVLSFMSALIVIGIVVLLWATSWGPAIENVLIDHFAAIIGIPGCVIAAFVIITFFRQSERVLQVKMLGCEFHGASGEIVLWTVVYLALVLSLKILWNL